MTWSVTLHTCSYLGGVCRAKTWRPSPPSLCEDTNMLTDSRTLKWASTSSLCVLNSDLAFPPTRTHFSPSLWLFLVVSQFNLTRLAHEWVRTSGWVDDPSVWPRTHSHTHCEECGHVASNASEWSQSDQIPNASSMCLGGAFRPVHLLDSCICSHYERYQTQQICVQKQCGNC